MKQLKVVIWCGKAANHKALANKIAAQFYVEGIVIDTGRPARKRKSLPGFIKFLYERLRFRKIYQSWKQLQHYYAHKFPEWPQAKLIKVSGINDGLTERFTREIAPDLIVVSGTGLIKEPLLSIPVSIGIINLHTGLSPYVKGGPNCTNWCIANNEFHLIGNTIMWLNAGIDSGNIITSETVNVLKAHDLGNAHRIVMEHAHELYLRAIKYLHESTPPYNSVQQEKFGKGNLFLTKMWTSSKKKMLLKNWRHRNRLAIFDNRPQTVELK